MTHVIDESPPKKWRGLAKKIVPLAVLAALIWAFFHFDGDHFLMVETLSDNRHALMGFVHDRMVLSVVLFLAAYTLATATAVPGAAVLTIAGGFLFGIAFGTLWVLIGATAGATILFLMARTIFADALRAKAGPFLQKMEAGFQENAFSYLLSLRLVPLFPFFLINIVPAFLGVSVKHYVLATALGILPGVFVYASIGAGLGSVFDMMMEFSLKNAVTPEIIIALVSLSVLSLAPAVYKRIKARRQAA